MFRRMLIAVLLLAAAGGLAACGGPSAAEQRQDAYVASIDQARASLAKALARLDAGAEPTGTPKTDARLLADYERAVSDVRLKLRSVTPPTVARVQHRQLVAALRGYEVALSRARRATAKRSTATIEAQREQLDTAATAASAKVDDAVAAIRTALTSP